MAVISLQHIKKQFGKKQVFNDFELEVSQGELLALTGASGSGKTTLLNMIGLIEPIASGSYTLLGEAAPKPNSSAAQKIIRQHISYLFQNFALVDNMTVEANLLMALHYTNQKKAEKRHIIESSLKKVGLNGYEKLKIYECSGGEQQRVAIARAMIKPSEILLADEPTGSLDAKNRDEVFAILKKLNAKGKTIIIVTHDEIIARRCHRQITL